MVVALYSDSKRNVARAHSCLSGVYDVIENADWDAFLIAAERAAVSVVILDRLTNRRIIADLAVFRDLMSMRRLVLVLPKKAELVRRFGRIPVSEVLWLREFPERLPSAVQRARTDNLLYRIAKKIEAPETSDSDRPTNQPTNKPSGRVNRAD